MKRLAEKTARNYIYGFIDREQMDRELLSLNRQWQNIFNGERVKGIL